MSKEIKYSITILGSIELEDDENLNDDQIMELVSETVYDNFHFDIGDANDVEYEIEEG